jgi:hypothetical protein
MLKFLATSFDVLADTEYDSCVHLLQHGRSDFMTLGPYLLHFLKILWSVCVNDRLQVAPEEVVQGQ